MPAPPGRPALELRLTVQPGDIDELRHVNNVVYVRWVQEAAIAHWTATADAADQAALVWVVTRHEIDYRRPARLGEELVVATWIGAEVGRDFERHTEFRRAADDKVLVLARTLWRPLDARTFQPTSVSASVRARFATPEGGAQA